MIGLRHAGMHAGAVLAAALRFAAPPVSGSEQPAAAAAKPDIASGRNSASRSTSAIPSMCPAPSAREGIPEYAFNLQLAQQIKQSLADAGFGEATLLITADGAVARPVRAGGARQCHACRSVYCHPPRFRAGQSVADLEYAGQEQHYNDDYPGYAIFISDDNPDRAGSLMFGHLLGMELQTRGLQYTPHYTLPLMGNRRRELV